MALLDSIPDDPTIIVMIIAIIALFAVYALIFFPSPFNWLTVVFAIFMIYKVNKKIEG